MSYRNGSYIAFHANGTNYPIDSDIKYYNIIKAWSEKPDTDFTINNSHDKTAAVRDSSYKETLKRSLKERLKNSRNMVLIIGETTKYDDDWVPFEIEYAIDECQIPIIITYIDVKTAIYDLSKLLYKLPIALRTRIENGTAHCIHIPFKKLVIQDAISQFSHNKLPVGGGLGIYSAEAYNLFNL